MSEIQATPNLTQIQMIMAEREKQYFLRIGRVREIKGTPNMNQIQMMKADKEKQYFLTIGRES